jgi:hypothetical protein
VVMLRSLCEPHGLMGTNGEVDISGPATDPLNPSRHTLLPGILYPPIKHSPPGNDGGTNSPSDPPMR